ELLGLQLQQQGVVPLEVEAEVAVDRPRVLEDVVPRLERVFLLFLLGLRRGRVRRSRAGGAGLLRREDLHTGGKADREQDGERPLHEDLRQSGGWSRKPCTLQRAPAGSQDGKAPLDTTPRWRVTSGMHESVGGWIEVISGVMFSGKSEELMRRVRRAMLARKRVQVFKSSLDARYGIDTVASHDGGRIQAEPVQTALELMEKVRPETEVV